MLIYVLYFLFLTILAIQYQFTPFRNNYVLLTVTVFLILLAGFRDIDVSKDYIIYQYLFDTVYYMTEYNGDSSSILNGFLAFEPGFVGIVLLFRSFIETNYGVTIMLFYALTSLSIKAYAINRLSINPYLSLLFYFSYFFLVQEMTQIRIGLASALFFISLISFINGKRGVFIGLIVLASLFHYSAIFYLVILLFDTKTFNRNFYIVLIILSLVLGFLKLPLLNLLGNNFDASDVSVKFDSYIQRSESGDIPINVFNSLNILNILCCFYFLVFIKHDALLRDKRLIVFLKCNILSIFLLSFLSGAPAFAFRFSELFSVAEIFLFTYLVNFLPAKKYNVFIGVLIAGFFFYVMEIHGNLLEPYKIIHINAFN